MADKKKIIAKYGVPDATNISGAHVVRDELREDLKRKELSNAVHLIIEQQTPTEVYVVPSDELEGTLRGFVEKSTLPVTLNYPYQEEKTNKQSKEHNGQAERYKDLSERLSVAGRRQKELETTITELENQITASKNVKGLHQTATPATLARTLEENEETYNRKVDELFESYAAIQEMLIAPIFYAFSDKVPTPEVELVTGLYKDVEDAETILAKKELYLRKHGPRAVEDLPAKEKRELLSSWEKAQKTVEAFKSLSLNMPLRLAETEEEAENGRVKNVYTIIIPVNPKSESVNAKKLIFALREFGKNLELQSKGVHCDYVSNQPFAMLQIKGEPPRGSMEEYIGNAINAVAENITLQLYVTPFLGKIPERKI